MNSGLMSHKQLGHMEMGPRFQISSKIPEKCVTDLFKFRTPAYIMINGHRADIKIFPKIIAGAAVG